MHFTFFKFQFLLRDRELRLAAEAKKDGFLQLSNSHLIQANLHQKTLENRWERAKKNQVPRGTSESERRDNEIPF